MTKAPDELLSAGPVASGMSSDGAILEAVEDLPADPWGSLADVLVATLRSDFVVPG